MSSTLIGDIRAVNMWNYVEPEWDGVTLPRPQKQLVVTNFELQVRKVILYHLLLNSVWLLLLKFLLF